MTGGHGQPPGRALGERLLHDAAPCRDRAIASGSLALLARTPHLLPPTRRTTPTVPTGPSGRARSAHSDAARAIGCSAQLGSTESLAASRFSCHARCTGRDGVDPRGQYEPSALGGRGHRATRLIPCDPRSCGPSSGEGERGGRGHRRDRGGSVLCPSCGELRSLATTLRPCHFGVQGPLRGAARNNNPLEGCYLLARSACGAGLRSHLGRAGSALPPARPKRLRRRAAPASPCCSASASRFPPCTPAASTAKALP